MPDPDVSACVPVIHLNGTSREQLVQDHMRALDLLRDACEQLCRCGPNGRDFYPKGQDAITAALTAHRDRVARLGTIMREVELIALGIASA